jgi:hypothetical protein
MVKSCLGDVDRALARYTAGAVSKAGRLPWNARVDGYDQLLVDAMRTASVAFGVALANGASHCEVQPVAGRGLQHFAAGHLHALEHAGRRL